MFTINHYNLHRPVNQLVGMALVILLGAPAWSPARAQSALLMVEQLSISDNEVCAGGSSVTFEIPVPDASQTVESIVWSVQMGNGDAGASNYELDAGVGSNLSDWDDSSILTFTPLSIGEFLVEANVTYASASDLGFTATGSIQSGAAPNTPFFNQFDPLLCEGDLADVIFSVTQPTSGGSQSLVSTTLAWSVTEVATGSVVLGNSTTSSNALITGAFGSISLTPGLYEVALNASNECGSSAASEFVEVVALPEFVIVAEDICLGDTLNVTSNFNLNDYTTADGTVATDFSVTWSLNDQNPSFNPQGILFTSTWDMADPSQPIDEAQFLNNINGDVVHHEIIISYEAGGEVEQCGDVASDEVFVYEPGTWEVNVTYPITYPPVCEGDDIELSVGCQETDELCDLQWNVSTPATSYSSTSPDCNSCSNSVAFFEGVPAPGISGTVTRTITVNASLECVNDIDLGLIEVLPTPDIEWVDGDNIVVACFGDEDASLEVQYSGSNSSPDTVTWQVDNPSNGSSWVWQDVVDNGSTSSLALINIDWMTLGITGDNSGSVNVTVSVVDGSGCVSNEITGLIQYFGVPSADGISFDPVCEGTTFQPIGVPVGGLEYEWYINEATPPPYSTLPFPVFEDLTCEDNIILFLYAEYLLAPGEVLICGADTTVFDLEIVPLPDLQFTVNGGNNLCAGETAEVCIEDLANDPSEACHSDQTDFFWRWRENAGPWNPPFPFPALTDACSFIPEPDGAPTFDAEDCVDVWVTAVSSVDTIPALTCAVDSVWEFCVAPTPEAEVLEYPEWVCPNTCFDVYAEDLTTEVLDGVSITPVLYEWFVCNAGPFTSAPPSVNQPDPLSGAATICLEDYDPAVDPLCLGLILTDANGCSDTTFISIDVKDPTTWDNLVVAPLTSAPTAVFCETGDSGSPLYLEDPVDAVCSGETLGATTTNVSTDPSYLDIEWNWNVTLAGQSINTTQGEPCVQFDTTLPCYDCNSGDSPSETVTIALSYFTIFEFDVDGNALGCTVDSLWETVDVFKNPCLEYDCPLAGCLDNNPWCCEIAGVDVLYSNDLEFTAFDDCGSVEVCLPIEPSVPLTGCNLYQLNPGEVLTCCTETVLDFEILPFNPPTVSCSEISQVIDDCVVCEGSDCSLTASPFNQIFDYDWEKNGDPLGSGQTLNLFDLQAEDPCTEATICEVDLVFKRGYNAWPGVVCSDTIPTPITILPTPTGVVTVDNPNLCDGETLSACVELECGVIEWDGTAPSWDWSCTGAITGSDPALSCKETVVNYNGDPCGETDDQIIDVIVTDGYGCSSGPIEVEYTVYELPNVTLEGEWVCSADPLEITACGADTYEWIIPPTDPVDYGPIEPAPTSCCPGDSTQTIVHNNPILCDQNDIEVIGCMVYPIAQDTLICCAEQESFNCVVFPTPVIDGKLLEEDLDGYCEGDIITFVNNAPCPDVLALQGCEYEYATNQGEEALTPATSWDFTALPDSTCLQVTKTCTYEQQGTPFSCSATWDTCVVVHPKPDISALYPEAICQGDTACIEILVNEIDSACVDDFDCFSMNLGALEQNLDGGSCNPCYPIGLDCSLQDPIDEMVYVIDCNMCSSDTLDVNIEVKATPLFDLVQALPDTVCSPSTECVLFELCNEDLDPSADIDYFPPLNGLGELCESFQNNTDCPSVDSLNWTILFTHMLVSDNVLVCENHGSDSLVILPSPDFEFTLCGQECLDPEDGNSNWVPAPSLTACDEDPQGIDYEWNLFQFDYEGGVIQNGGQLAFSTTDTNLLIEADSAGVYCPVVTLCNNWGTHTCCTSSPNPGDEPGDDDNCWYVRPLPIPVLGFEQESICIPTQAEITNASIGATQTTIEILDTTVVDFESPFVYPIEFPGYYNVWFEACKEWLPPPCADPTIETENLVCCVDTEYTAAFEGCLPPIASFDAPDSVEWVDPYVQFTNTSSDDAIEFNWFFSDGDVTSVENPEHYFTSYGTYSAMLEVVNECGCTDTAFQEVEVWRDVYLFVPSAFTPGSPGAELADGINDAWFPVIRGEENIATYSCQVFSRSGDVVFSTDDITARWDGTDEFAPGQGSHFVQNDVYLWRIAIKRKRGEGAEIFTGQVTVIR